MWNFIKQYSYDAVKLFVTQFAIGIFGFSLSLASAQAQNAPLTIVCSVFAVFFYLFLIYTSLWEMGAKDQISVEYGHQPYCPRKGLYIALLACVLNVLAAIGIALIPAAEAICRLYAVVAEGMYNGILSIRVADQMLNTYPIFYFLIPIPALLTAWLAYFLGLKNIRLTGSLFAPNGQQKNGKK